MRVVLLSLGALALAAAAWWFPWPTRVRTALVVDAGDLAPVAAARPWRWLVIHHSATAAGSVAAFDRGHRERGWDGVGYHFVIGNGHGMPLGEIRATARWLDQAAGAHAGQAEYNADGIGICLIGDYDTAPPDPLVLERLAWLCAVLLRRHDLPPSALIGHDQVPGKATRCPGRHFDLAALRRRVAALGPQAYSAKR
jgi:N-acetyl-anhydromuramyl-L-alanine amidase AmpD